MTSENNSNSENSSIELINQTAKKIKDTKITDKIEKINSFFDGLNQVGNSIEDKK